MVEGAYVRDHHQYPHLVMPGCLLEIILIIKTRVREGHAAWPDLEETMPVTQIDKKETGIDMTHPMVRGPLQVLEYL